MPLLPGLGGIINVGGGAAGLDFSALTSLPAGRQSAVTTAAESAATTLSVSAQSIIDALAVGRGLASLLPNDGCLLASSGGAVTVQDDPVGAIRSWTGIELAVQANVSTRPVSGANGLVTDGGRLMQLSGLVVGNLEAFWVTQTAAASGIFASWAIGSGADSYLPFSDGNIYDSFGTDTRINSIGGVLGIFARGIYNPSLESGTLTLRWNGSTVASQTGLANALAATPRLFQSQSSFFYSGTSQGFALNLTTYTTAQRAAVEQFCKAYYGVSY